MVGQTNIVIFYQNSVNGGCFNAQFTLAFRSPKFATSDFYVGSLRLQAYPFEVRDFEQRENLNCRNPVIYNCFLDICSTNFGTLVCIFAH